MPIAYDVVIATDCRLPGGTAVSSAEEIAAQARSGLRSGLFHLDSPLVSRTRPLNPRLREAIARGDVDLLLPDDKIVAKLLVLRHPKVALELARFQRRQFDVERCVVLANQVPVVDGRVIYTAAEVNAVVEAVVGHAPLWAPIGPLVREEFVAVELAQEMVSGDWVNIIDVEAWAIERPPLDGRPVRIGRHSRDHWLKWPSSRQEMLAAYPDSDDVVVNVLGGIPQAATVLGGSFPANWNTFQFGSRHPMDFLADVDIFVYFHHRELTEAFGRNILEAMASGAPVITDRKFEPLFGESVLYTEPEGVLELVRTLAADPDRYLEASRRGQTFARRHFGYEEHVRRIGDLVDIEPRAAARPVPVARGRTSRNVLFISPNGAGMGHLARMLAVASRLPPGLTPRFLTFSTAAAVVERAGYPVDYVPSRPVTSSSSAGWHQALAARLATVLAETEPAVVVIDGTDPYRGLLRALIDHPDIPVVWSRRGMWRAGVSNAVIEQGESFFDLILEPGEFAAELDTGATTGTASSQRVGPVTYVRAEAVLERAEARRHLGLPRDGACVLLTLGAGNINDTESVLDVLVEEASRHPDLHVVTTSSPISLRERGLDELTTTISVFPLAKYLRAFDFAVAAAGYNSFHEMLVGRVPTLFIPNLETITDDQLARATWAEKQGLAISADERDLEDVRMAFRRLVVDEERARLSDAMASMAWTDGADEMAARVAQLAMTKNDSSPSRRDTRRHAYELIEAAVRRRSPSVAERALADGPGAREMVKRAARRTINATRHRMGDERAAALLGRAPTRVRARVERLMTGGTARRTGRKASLRVPPGRLIPEEQADRLAGVLVVLAADGDISGVVDAIARRQVIERTFAPVFLTSSIESAPAFGRYGYVWEHLRRRSDAETDHEWAARRTTRLAQVRQWYRPSFVVEATTVEDVDDESLLARFVRSLDPT